MKRLNPDKLYVEYQNNVTAVEPIIGRKYTLTHSDLTGDLFLTIGMEYAYDKVTALRDEFLAEWRMDQDVTFLFGYVYINGKFSPEVAAVRNTIFRRELPLALEAVRYGDREFFEAHPELDFAPIWILFDSSIEEYHRFEYWGSPNDYTHYPESITVNHS